MSAYLQNLVARTLGTAVVVRPNIGPRVPGDRPELDAGSATRGTLPLPAEDQETLRAGAADAPAGNRTAADAPVRNRTATGAPVGHRTDADAEPATNRRADQARRLSPTEKPSALRTASIEICRADGDEAASTLERPSTVSTETSDSQTLSSAHDTSPQAPRMKRAITQEVAELAPKAVILEQHGAEPGDGAHRVRLDDARSSYSAIGAKSATAANQESAGTKPGRAAADASEPQHRLDPADRLASMRRLHETGSLRRREPQAPDLESAGKPEDTIINVTIGRIEVRAPVAPARAKAAPEDVRKPSSAGAQLDAYLRSRNQARR